MSLEEQMRMSFISGMRGGDTHMDPFRVLDGLKDDEVHIPPADGIMTIWEQLTHMQFWQELLIQNIKEGKPSWHDIDWKNEYPPNYKVRYGKWIEFSQAVKDTIIEIQNISKIWDLSKQYPILSNVSAAHILRFACSHLSYHIGQIALTRKILGFWPPPESKETSQHLI